MNNSINLLDYKNKINPKKDTHKQRVLRLIAIGILSVVAASSVTFFILIALSPIPELRKQEIIASQKLSQEHTDIVKLLLIKERTDKIVKLIANRSRYDNELDLIMAKLPSGVIIDAVDIDKNHFLVTFSSNSLSQLDMFLNQLTSNNGSEKGLSNITIANLSNDNERAKFLLTLNMGKL
jgi:hypothetical protein